MTKEENIATLNEHLTHWKRLLSEKICDQDEGEKTIDALQNAIKALEQQPTDAVDRVTIKEYLESFEVAHPKMGRWITWKEAGNDIPSETRFECSVCHDAAQTLCNGLDLLSTYCPNCGAKMQEVKNDKRTGKT